MDIETFYPTTSITASFRTCFFFPSQGAAGTSNLAGTTICLYCEAGGHVGTTLSEQFVQCSSSRVRSPLPNSTLWLAHTVYEAKGQTLANG